MSNNLQSIRALIDRATAEITESESARLDAELLLASLLQKSRSWLHTWPDRTIQSDLTTRFNRLVARRISGEPVAYLLGSQPFWTLELKVTADTLIPRPETELLVETALAAIPVELPCRVADLGTGSGAIALAIATERPNATIFATDQSEAALAVAQENATRHQLNNITFLAGSWFTPLTGEPFDLILSNPPYIAESDPHLAQGDLRFEPPRALRSGDDGLDDLKQIIKQASQYLHHTGQLMVEHGYEQGNAVRSLFQKHNFNHIETQRDLGGEERITHGTRK